MPLASALAALIIATVATPPVDGAKTHPVLKPGAQEPVKQCFEHMGPTLVYDSIDIDHDHVVAKVCKAADANDCFQIRLDPPRTDCPTSTGPFCVQFPRGPLPPESQKVVDSALRSANGPAIWTYIPVAAPQHDFGDLLSKLRAKLPGKLAQAGPVELAMLVLLLAFGLLVTRYLDGPGSTARRGALEIPLAIAVAVFAFVWLKHANPITGTTGAVFLSVADCLFFGLCQTLGAGSSVLLQNGAVWPEILVAVHRFGGTMGTVHTTVILFLAIGVGLVFLVTWRLTRPALATPTAALAIGMVGLLTLASPLIDCSITFLFSTAAAACLLAFALSRNTLPLIAGAVLASHAVNSHTSAVSILPALLFLPPLAGKSPMRSATLALATFAAATAFTSWQAVIGDWVALRGVGLLLFVILGSAALVVAGAVLNPQFKRLAATQRAWVVGVALIAPHLAGVAVLLAIHHPVLPRYLPPVVAPLSIALVVGLAWALSRSGLTRPRSWGGVLLTMLLGIGVMSQNDWGDGSIPEVGVNGAWPPLGASLAVIEAMPESKQLDHEALQRMLQLVDRLRQGAVGEGAVDATFGFTYSGLSEEGALRVEIKRTGGLREGFILLRPPIFGTGALPKYFMIMPDDGIDRGRVAQLSALFDGIFTTNPWVIHSTTTGEGSGLASVSFGRALAGSLFIALSLVLGILLILGSHSALALGTEERQYPPPV